MIAFTICQFGLVKSTILFDFDWLLHQIIFWKPSAKPRRDSSVDWPIDFTAKWTWPDFIHTNFPTMAQNKPARKSTGGKKFVSNLPPQGCPACASHRRCQEVAPLPSRTVALRETVIPKNPRNFWFVNCPTPRVELPSNTKNGFAIPRSAPPAAVAADPTCRSFRRYQFRWFTPADDHVKRHSIGLS
jgi:hypothetical protein